MTYRRDRFGLVITFGIACFAILGSQTVLAQVKLEYKFQEGKKLTYKTNSRVRQVLRLMGMDVESIKKETKEWSRSIGKRRDNLMLPVEEKVESLRVDYTLPDGIKLTLDSSNSNIKLDNTSLAFLGDVFKLESTIAYVVVLDKEAKVKAIEGTEKLRDKAQNLNNTIAREELQNEFRAERLKTRFEQELRTVPEAMARTGEPWERTEILEINGKTFTVRKKYEYRGTEKKGDKTLEKIGSKVLEVKYTEDPNGKLPLKVVKSDLKVESSQGTILFDRQEGYVFSNSARIRIKGEVGYLGAGVEQSGTFDLTFDSNTELQPATK